MVILSLLLGSCKKNSQNDKDDEIPAEIPADMELLVTPEAEAMGTAITKIIGPEGGNLSIPGDSVKITVPAGALTAATTFSIQPIESTLQKKPGKVNYELLPHNVTFNKPVEVTFKYSAEMFKYNEEVLVVAYRDDAGKWHDLPTALDKNARTLTVEKSSFSEFEFYEKYVINTTSDRLNAAESAKISLGYLYESNDDLLAPLVRHFESENRSYVILTEKNVTKITGWSIIDGPGTIAPIGDFKAEATYTAPDMIDSIDYAIIQVRVQGVKPIPDRKAPGGKRLTGELILRQDILLLGGWIKLTMLGKTYTLTKQLTAGITGKMMGIGGENEDGTISVNMAVNIEEVRGDYAGSYPWGELYPGTANAGIIINDQLYQTMYHDCGKHAAVQSSGKAEFTTWSQISGIPVTGGFSSVVHAMTNDCDHTSTTATITYKIPRN